MNWNSWSEFWAMGGYALYVWGAYGMVVSVMLLEPLQASRRFRKAHTRTHPSMEDGA